jgi:hypothetical protein
MSDPGGCSFSGVLGGRLCDAMTKFWPRSRSVCTYVSTIDGAVPLFPLPSPSLFPFSARSVPTSSSYVDPGPCTFDIWMACLHDSFTFLTTPVSNVYCIPIRVPLFFAVFGPEHSSLVPKPLLSSGEEEGLLFLFFLSFALPVVRSGVALM